ncbi:dihydrolipoamide dehydrogenase [Lederbergia galactosidilyticus]|uniref:dihydrolipoyl dehydrogenase n=1 Tax=Lederbergia galactosidilytica TaxID=217031 RepID=UPI001AE8CD80|nr:dihydrolipoyl dehydrogenase [Lederbergia galactosidilytica]MBP1914723.1 dihydrolipoamide dehydrogenase [Lederbergia galactosidilytica]
MATEYDLVILGGGTGGYVAAIRASQLGLKTAIVEQDKLGGTCLHKGCIPSKAMLRSAEVFSLAKRSIEFGISTDHVHLHIERVQERKNKIVNQLFKGVQHLIEKGNIDVYNGIGTILGPSIFSPLPGTVSVELEDDNELLIPKNLILATGSKPRTLPGLEIDGDTVLTSEHALELTQLPKSILIIGGGAIGIEWASMLVDFGVEVTVLEYADHILPNEDKDISRELAKVLEKKGIKFITNAKVLAETVQKSSDGATIQVETGEGIKSFTGEKILVSVGREANISQLGLQNTDIRLEKNFIQVNRNMQTQESHIYAIGDIIGGLQLAHVASHEGILAVEHIAGLNPSPLDYQNVPRCVYSSPEVASIGLTEKEALNKGFKVKIGKFPFIANGKALVLGDTTGFVKIIANRENQDLLGVHMIGPNVTDLISEAGLAHVLDATPWEVGTMIHPHPSLSETIGEAALAVDRAAIHI